MISAPAAAEKNIRTVTSRKGKFSWINLPASRRGTGKWKPLRKTGRPGGNGSSSPSLSDEFSVICGLVSSPGAPDHSGGKPGLSFRSVLLSVFLLFRLLIGVGVGIGIGIDYFQPKIRRQRLRSPCTPATCHPLPVTYNLFLST